MQLHAGVVPPPNGNQSWTLHRSSGRVATPPYAVTIAVPNGPRFGNVTTYWPVFNRTTVFAAPLELAWYPKLGT